MGRYEDYLENHGNEPFESDEEEIEKCEVCGVDFGKLYHFEGECLCEDCLMEKYYYGDAVEFPTPICCDLCGEPIEGAVYCVPDAKGDCVFYDEECLFDLVEN